MSAREAVVQEAGRVLSVIDPATAPPVQVEEVSLADLLDDPVAMLDVGASWQPVDTAAVVEGLRTGTINRPTPTILTRSDGTALFYAGRVNGVAGASGDGKSMILQWAAVAELQDGETVVYVDLEDDAPSVISRLLAMGADPAAVIERFVYVQPDEPYGGDARTGLEAIVAARRPSLVVIDSTGESLALDGAKPNDDDDVARWFQRLPRGLARLGPAVVVIDHMAKADDGSLSPIGSQRKRAAIGGAQYITSVTTPFSREVEGVVQLICGKDRPGTFRRGEVAAIVTVTPDPERETIGLRVDAPTEAQRTFRPTCLMERASRVLEDASEPMTRNQVLDAVKGNRKAAAQALRLLVEGSYVEQTKQGKAHHHRIVKPYREVDG